MDLQLNKPIQILFDMKHHHGCVTPLLSSCLKADMEEPVVYETSCPFDKSINQSINLIFTNKRFDNHPFLAPSPPFKFGFLMRWMACCLTD
jgi:hypothetical protein